MKSQQFFQTNGPIIDIDRSLYIEREEDQRLLALLRGAEMPYVTLMGPPQIGKTSLFYHLRRSLTEGYIPVIVNLSAASDAAEQQWYSYLCRRILAQIHTELEKAGEIRDISSEISNKLEFLDFLENIASHVRPQARIVVMLDEFGTIPKDVAEGFFSILRTTYNDRGIREAFQKYGFILAGMMETREAFPVDWINSPFNISQKIYLSDLSPEGTYQLAGHLEKSGVQFDDKERALKLIYRLTGGHPNLVQKLCVLLADMKGQTISSEHIEQVADCLISDGDDNIYWVREHLSHNKAMEHVVREILAGGKYRFDRNDPLLRRLELIGGIKESQGDCVMRNEIYERALKDFPPLVPSAS